MMRKILKYNKAQTKRLITIIIPIIVTITIILAAFYYFNYHRRSANLTDVSAGMSVEELEKIVEKEPGNKQALEELSRIYYHNFDYDRAARTYEKYIAVEDNNAAVYSSLASVYRDKGESTPSGKERDGLLSKAAEFFEKAIEKDAMYIKAYLDYADMLNAQKRKAEAISLVEKGVESNPNDEKLARLKVILEK